MLLILIKNSFKVVFSKVKNIISPASSDNNNIKFTDI